jgi:hypothetical protein
MDPDEVLKRIREACAELDSELASSDHVSAASAGALVSAVQDLDEWLSRGGFLPIAWVSGE